MSVHAGMSSDRMAALVQSLDARKADAFMPADREKIRGQICDHHGDLATFSAKLKLRLLLSPLGYKADVDKLLERSRSTQWDLRPVARWAADPAGSRVLVIPAGSGTGKSTISAVLVSACWKADAEGNRNLVMQDGADMEAPNAPLAPTDQSGPKKLIDAHHFFKYNDQRRLDLVAVIKSLAYQLAERCAVNTPRTYACLVDGSTYSCMLSVPVAKNTVAKPGDDSAAGIQLSGPLC